MNISIDKLRVSLERLRAKRHKSGDKMRQSDGRWTIKLKKKRVKRLRTKVMYVREREKSIFEIYSKKMVTNAKLFNLCVYSVYVYIVRLVRIVGGRNTTDSSRASISKARLMMIKFCPFSFKRNFYEIYFRTF